MLLFDQNLPLRLVDSLADLYPSSQHVRSVGLASAGDAAVWKAAAEQQLAIISKDRDFYDRCQTEGPPPKVVWLRCGNCSVSYLERLLRYRYAMIIQFFADSQSGILILE